MSTGIPDGATQRATSLAAFVRGLTDFEVYTTIDGDYDHIGATVADAILQANRRYASFVKPRVSRILEYFPTHRTTTAALDLLQTTPTADFLRLNDPARAARVDAVLALLMQEGVDTEAELREWLLHGDGVRKLRAIHGIGPKTGDYFKILVGIPESAIDRHLFGFLALAGMEPVGYEEAQVIINATADLLGVGRAHFDHSIWQYMSRRAEVGHARKPVVNRAGAPCDVSDGRESVARSAS